MSQLDGILAPPYHTEVQLYRSLEALSLAIHWHALTEEQRDAVRRLNAIMADIASTFHRAFGMDIDDPRTVYALCRAHLVPAADEPHACLSNLPGARAS